MRIRQPGLLPKSFGNWLPHVREHVWVNELRQVKWWLWPLNELLHVPGKEPQSKLSMNRTEQMKMFKGSEDRKGAGTPRHNFGLFILLFGGL